MKVFLILVLLTLSTFPVQAQLGISGEYMATQDWWKEREKDQQGQTTGWDFIDYGWNVGIDYHFNFKNSRIEFQPELNYAFLTRRWDWYLPEGKEATSVVSLFFNTNFYLFDLNGDCDCPTFSKEGSFLKKGFFVQLSPGISHWWIFDGRLDEPLIDMKRFSLSLGGSVGLDIGVSRTLTITPMFNVRAHQEMKVLRLDTSYFYSGDDAGPGPFPMYASPVFWSTGLRLGLNLQN